MGKPLEELSPVEWVERIFLMPVMDQHPDPDTKEAEEKAESHDNHIEDFREEQKHSQLEGIATIALLTLSGVFLAMILWLASLFQEDDQGNQDLLRQVSEKEEKIREKAKTIRQERRSLDIISQDILDMKYPYKLVGEVHALKQEIKKLRLQSQSTEKETKERGERIDDLQKTLTQKEEELKKSDRKRQENEVKWAWEKIDWLQAEDDWREREEKFLSKQQNADSFKEKQQQKESKRRELERQWQKKEEEWDEVERLWLKKEEEMQRTINESKTRYATKLWDCSKAIKFLKKEAAMSEQARQKALETSKRESSRLKNELNSTQQNLESLSQDHIVLRNQLNHVKEELGATQISATRLSDQLKKATTLNIYKREAQVAEELQNALASQKKTMRLQFDEAVAELDTDHEAAVKCLKDQLRQSEDIVRASAEHQATIARLEAETEQLRSENHRLTAAMEQQMAAAASQLAAPEPSQPVAEVTDHEAETNDQDEDLDAEAGIETLRSLAGGLQQGQSVKPRPSTRAARDWAAQHFPASSKTKIQRRRPREEEVKRHEETTKRGEKD